jgi:hypothetical protein
MKGHLYRYPHPYSSDKFIYAGQGEKRDNEHRGGRTSFGRRFEKLFPGIELPNPVRETIEVRDYLELNELEIIWMFQYHTWRGYPGGMNLTLPGSIDYRSMGLIGGRVQGPKNVESGALAKIQSAGGRVSGRMNSESGRIQELGHTQGRKNVESGQLASIQSMAGRAGGRIALESGQFSGIRSRGNHSRWHIARGISRPSVCSLCAETENLTRTSLT